MRVSYELEVTYCFRVVYNNHLACTKLQNLELFSSMMIQKVAQVRRSEATNWSFNSFKLPLAAPTSAVLPDLLSEPRASSVFALPSSPTSEPRRISLRIERA